MSVDIYALVCAAAITFYAAGSYKALELLVRTIRVEKKLRRLGFDYEIKNKVSMYIICIIFSWLAFSALKRQQ